MLDLKLSDSEADIIVGLKADLSNGIKSEVERTILEGPVGP